MFNNQFVISRFLPQTISIDYINHHFCNSIFKITIAMYSI